MKINLGGRDIGDKEPVLIVAELSANHLQDFDLAVKTIEAIRKSGADAVKFQTYTPDTMTIDCDNRYFKIKHGSLWDGKTLYELYKEAFTPWEWQEKLKKAAEKCGLLVFSTPFDRSAVDFLESIKMPAYKIASCEITDIPFIEYVASKRKPVILSTGVAILSDIEEAVSACRRAGNNKIALLKCTSAYPTPLNEVNLNTITDLKNKFKAVIGISDHTLGNTASVASVALGAKIIERHFIIDRKLKGVDSAFSLEPEEFREMVKAVREAEMALGEVTYELTAGAGKSRTFARSIFAVGDIKKGEVFTEKNVRSIRPGYGLAPKYLKDIIGKPAKKDIKRGTPLTWEMVTR